MKQLLKYIRSTFNYTHDIDTKNEAINPKLQLLDKSLYNIFVTDITIPNYEYLTDEYTALVQKAADEWSRAINNKIRFKVINTLQGADIKLYWIKSKRAYAARQNTDYNLIAEKLVLNIGIMDMHEKLYSVGEAYHLLLHELGHILTLGHSPIKGDVMSCLAEWPEKLSKNDIFVLNLIYSLGSGVSYLEKEAEIKKRVEKFLSSYPSAQKPVSKQKIKLITENQNPKALLDTLDSIEEINKYKLTLQNIELDSKTRQQFSKPKYISKT